MWIENQKYNFKTYTQELFGTNERNIKIKRRKKENKNNKKKIVAKHGERKRKKINKSEKKKEEKKNRLGKLIPSQIRTFA